MRISRRAFLAASATFATAACGGVTAKQVDAPGSQTVRARVPAIAVDTAPTPPPAPTATPTPLPAWPITVAAVGDVMLARSVANAITESDPAGPFHGVRHILEEASIAVANVECAISDRGAPEPKAYTFRASPRAARGVALAGIDAVSLANNHALDYGPDALLDTSALLGAEGVLAAGAGPNLAAALAPALLERNGVRIAVLGFADVPSESGYDMRAWEAGESSPGIAWAEPVLVTAAVQAARTDADLVIVMFHFGAEYASTPSESQRVLSRGAIDAGAHLVIGSHPHVLQEVEEYGAALIAYSLGNFVFDGFEGSSNTTAILRATFDAAGLASWELLPATIGWDGLPTLDA